jgi:PRTRC genetic system protein E
MSFFKSIEQHLEGMNLNVVISKNDNGLTVSVLPQPTCKDEAMKNLAPILLKGTADELDAQFAGIIQQPLQKVSGISTNLVQFEKNVEVQAEKTAIVKAEKDAKKKITDMAEKHIVEAEKLIKEDKISEAILKIKAALKIYPESKKAKDLMKKHIPTDDMFAVKEEVKLVERIKEEIVEVVMASEPTSMKEVGMEEQQRQTLPPNSLQKVDPNTGANIGNPVDLSEPITIAEVAEASPQVEIVSVAPIVLEVPVYNKVDSNGKPIRQDLEPMTNFETRLIAWVSATATIPAAANPHTAPIVEEISPMQEMAEMDMVKREAEFENEKVVPVPVQVPVQEVKVEVPIVPPTNNNIEILG